MPSDPYHVMVKRILPRAVKRFLEKSADYEDLFFDLGLAGQYSDMHRKMHKLRKALWEGEELKGEQPEEILEDLIGNCMISIYLLQHDQNGTKSQRSASSQSSGGQDTDAQRAPTGRSQSGARKPQANAVRKSASS